MSENAPVLKIDDALEYYESTKAKSKPGLLKIDLARLMFKNSNEKTMPVLMSNVISGKTARIDPEWVKAICKATGVDANFLFGIAPMDEKLKKQFYENK